MAGVKVPGFKLVEGRSSRSYALDDEEIIALLTEAGYSEDDLIIKRLRTVADMEKYLSKAVFNELLGEAINKTTGAPTLVPIDDKRPEINSAASAAADFQNLN